MKKALALLLLAGLAFAPVASFATVVDEGLGQGSGFGAALNTGSYDLVQLFPEQASNFANAAYWRFGIPDFDPAPGTTNSGYDGNGLIFGSDNWFGVIDAKHGIGTWSLFVNVPVNFFTDDAGANPDLRLQTETDGWNNTYTNVGGFEPTHEAGWGATSNNWGAIVNHWAEWNGTGYTNVTGGDSGPSGVIGNQAYLGDYIQTPNNKFVLTFADQGFGLSVNYGDQAGDYWDYNKTTYSITPSNPGAGTWLGYKQYADQVQEFGLSVGYGTKDAGPFSNVDASVGFELGMVNMIDSENEQNAANSGVNNYYIDQVKDNGIYDVRLNVLATKDTDDATQIRTSLNGVLSQLGTEEIAQYDSNNNGSFTDEAGVDNNKRDTNYSNLDLNLNAACVHKVEGGKGRLVASIGVQYRDQHFTDQGYYWVTADNKYEYVYYSDSDFVNFLVPVRVGAEQDLNDWLTVRVGASANAFASYSDTTIGRDNQDAQGNYQNKETNTSWNDQFMNPTFDSGFSVKLSNFTFDALLDETWFENTFLNTPVATIFVSPVVVNAKAEASYKF